MRVVFVIASLVFGTIGVIAANATENQVVVVRSDRSAPLHRQHYYPTTGVKPKIGRAEDSSAPSNAPEPGQTYRRQY